MVCVCAPRAHPAHSFRRPGAAGLLAARTMRARAADLFPARTACTSTTAPRRQPARRLHRACAHAAPAPPTCRYARGTCALPRAASLQGARPHAALVAPMGQPTGATPHCPRRHRPGAAHSVRLADNINGCPQYGQHGSRPCSRIPCARTIGGGGSLRSPRMCGCPNLGRHPRAKQRPVLRDSRGEPRDLAAPATASPSPRSPLVVRGPCERTRSLRHNGWTEGRGIRHLI